MLDVVVISVVDVDVEDEDEGEADVEVVDHGVAIGTENVESSHPRSMFWVESWTRLMVDTLGGPPPGGGPRPAELDVVVVVGAAGTARAGVSWAPAVVESAGTAAGVLWAKSTDDSDSDDTGFPGRVGGALIEDDDEDDDNDDDVVVDDDDDKDKGEASRGWNGGAAMAAAAAVVVVTTESVGRAVIRAEKCIPSGPIGMLSALPAALAIDAAEAVDCDDDLASPWPDTPASAPS